MNGLRQWLLNLLVLGLVLLGAATVLDAGTIYGIEGWFVPTLTTIDEAPFTGSLEFFENQDALLKLDYVGEHREVPLTLEANLMSAMDTRIYTGTWDDSPMNVIALDYDGIGGDLWDAGNLDYGGEWDSWTINFRDIGLGTVLNMRGVPQVNEPSTALLAVLASLLAFGMIRTAAEKTRS